MLYNWNLENGEHKRHSFPGLHGEPQSSHKTVCIIWQEKGELFVCILVLYICHRVQLDFWAAMSTTQWLHEKTEMQPHLCNEFHLSILKVFPVVVTHILKLFTLNILNILYLVILSIFLL
jgi:hypothetical protein